MFTIKNKKGFTLIEILIVVVIIGVLATALIPKLQNSLARTRNSKRTTDINTIYQAMKLYSTDRGRFPSNTTGLVGNYLSSLPADPSALSACTYPYAGNPYASLMQRGAPLGGHIDANNYYADKTKGYYYNVLSTGSLVPGRSLPTTPTIAVLGSYMEKTGTSPLSNVPVSSLKALKSIGRGSACAEYAIWMLFAGVGYGRPTAQALPVPEAINTPEYLPIIQTIYTGVAYNGIGSALYDMTEGDYLMLMTK